MCDRIKTLKLASVKWMKVMSIVFNVYFTKKNITVTIISVSKIMYETNI